MPHICWVCGFDSPTREDLFEHVHSQHEEGVDYLRCPVCAGYVRDMVVHFEHAHPGAMLPTGIPLRARFNVPDHRKAWRRAQKNHNKSRFKQGFFESTKNSCQLHYRSSWELAVYKILEKAFSVKAYKVEPFPIPYDINGSNRNYWPDIWIQFTDDSVMVVEVKPLGQCPTREGVCESATQAINDAKWRAAQTYCERRNWEFAVWTERAIKQLGRKKSDQLTKSELMCRDAIS
jgi:hypothetical protein